MAKRCYYEVLEVTREADDETLKKSYRKLAMKYHPDRNPGDAEADARFKEAAEAFQVLSDPEKRQLYDRYGHAALDGTGAPGFSSADDIMNVFGDLFDGLFGGGGRRRRGPRQGGDVRHDLEIDLVEAYRGVKKDIKVPRHERCKTCSGSGCKPGSKPVNCRRCDGRGVVIQGQGFFRIQQTCSACRGQGATINDPCGTCRGQGMVRVERELTLNVPAGVDNDMRLCVEGEGESGDPGAPSGDLVVFLKVREHPLFARRNQELHCEVPITFPQASLGATIEVPTLEGTPVSVTVKRGTQPGEQIRIPGKGMPHVHTGRKGDLIVHLRVVTPRNLTRRQEELLQELSELDGKNVAPERKGFFDRVREFFASIAGTGEESKT